MVVSARSLGSRRTASMSTVSPGSSRAGTPSRAVNRRSAGGVCGSWSALMRRHSSAARPGYLVRARCLRASEPGVMVTGPVPGCTGSRRGGELSVGRRGFGVRRVHGRAGWRPPVPRCRSRRFPAHGSAPVAGHPPAGAAAGFPGRLHRGQGAAHPGRAGRGAQAERHGRLPGRRLRARPRQLVNPDPQRLFLFRAAACSWAAAARGTCPHAPSVASSSKMTARSAGTPVTAWPP